MKQNLIYMGVALTALLSAGCTESLPDNFGKVEGVYFNNQQTNSTHVDATSLTFIYEDNDEMDVPVKVQLMGRIAAEDRPVSIRVTSNDAVEGIDYELKTIPALPSGSSAFDYVITLKRTTALQSQVKTLVVELAANDYFILPFATLTHTDGTQSSAVSYRIEFSNQFTAPPVGWGTDYVGEFSQQKFELVCDVLDIPRSDFNVQGKITFAKWMYIQSTMTEYVQEQVALKVAGKPYDTNAFDAAGVPLSFIAKS